MKANKIVNDFKRGYYRPITIPLWKALIVYLLWIISLVGYILAIRGELVFTIIGVVFQTLALFLPIKWDTGNWRDTERCKEYINKYYK